ncbi:MAG TPA: hypothetical protein PKN99_12755, partial [Cyclobacteriaceae bacterium]|nr:hypothetical protein [Cyclobacteriaceae bacterium]
RDGDNHNAKMVELQSGETILNTSFLILEVTGVFDQIRVGDFIVKENGSLKLEVKRNNSELDFILDYGCND